MPSIPTRVQQPKPVSPQVPIPNDFPEIPKEILDRFPSAADWQRRLNEFWTRTNQALQQAQTQAAAYANSRVTYTVDTFRIYVNGVSTPMFAIDDTGVRLGNVLVINTPGRKVYIGAGTYQSADTPFYIDTLGYFSLGQNLTWNPDTGTLAITGTITATTGSIGGFDIGTDYIRDLADSMGMASTVTGGDDVRFWAGDTFANRASAPFNVTESGILTATNAAVIVGTVSGRLTATLAAAINAAGNLITDVVNPRLDSDSKTILSDFNFGAVDYAGAVKSGTITWNTTTGAITGGSGVVVYRSGIVGAAAGVATFTLDAATGNATFAGTLSAPTGTIGGWTINSTTLTGGNATLDSVGQLILGTVNDVVVLSAADATYRIWIGNAVAGSAAFNVTKAGVLTATGATITGSITATAGTIGGFSVGADYIRDTANSMGMASTVTGGDDVRFWAGNTFANRASAPFRITESGEGQIGPFTFTATGLSSGGVIIESTSITNNSPTRTFELLPDSLVLYTNLGVPILALSDTGSGRLEFLNNGGSIVVTDVNLYRSAANTWKTDDSFDVAGTLTGVAATFTGTLTGVAANFTGSVATSATASAFSAAGATTSFRFGNVSNTGGQVYWGVESNSGGSVITGTSAYAGFIGTANATDFYIARNSAAVALFTATGINSTNIGATTPGTGAFTTLSATGTFTSSGLSPSFGGTTGSFILSLGGGNSSAADGASVYIKNNGTTVGALGNRSQILGGAYDATLMLYSLNDLELTTGGTTVRLSITSGGTVNIAALAGAGTRTVVADASGNLSAP